MRWKASRRRWRANTRLPAVCNRISTFAQSRMAQLKCAAEWNDGSCQVQRHTASPLQSAHPRLGAGLAASYAAALAGPDGSQSARRATGVRPGLLSLPRESARGWRAKSELSVDL